MDQYHGHNHCIYRDPIKNEVARAPNAYYCPSLDDPF